MKTRWMTCSKTGFPIQIRDLETLQIKTERTPDGYRMTASVHLETIGIISQEYPVSKG